jgi:homoserine/homoserine lactone efflux protein
MHTQTFLIYLATWTLVALSPGPAVLFSMAASVRSGFRHGFAGIAGIQAGNVIFFVCTGFGLGALLSGATRAFTVLRWVGALYLMYLGGRIIVSTFCCRERPTAQPSDASDKPKNLFLRGLLIQITNPKALLFVSALLPQFIDAGRTVATQLGILGVTTVLVDTTVLGCYAFFASRGAQTFRDSRAAIALERLFGAALILFGVRLMWSRR